MKKRTALSLVAFHLAALSLGFFPNFPPPAWKKPLALREAYQALTGAGGSFGFFSPGIGNQLLLRFETKPPLAEPLVLDRLVNGEVALRLGNMYRLLGFAYGNEKVKRAVAASLAANIFRLHPEISETTLVASIYHFPALAAYRSGERPSTQEAYRVTFRLGAGR